MMQLVDTVGRYDWLCHAYCLMDNHYHLLIETQQPTLSKGMKYLNGKYTQDFNKRYARSGHVFQGRFKSILVDSNSYLLEVARYIVLNPVRARMLHSPEEWPWSSYRATAGMTSGHDCLTTDWVLSVFSQNKRSACARYREFIEQGAGQPSPWESLTNQIYLGSDQFVEDMLAKIEFEQSLDDIPKSQKCAPPKPLEYYAALIDDRDRAMATAYLDRHYTLQEVGSHFGVNYATVSRAVKRHELDVKCKA